MQGNKVPTVTFVYAGEQPAIMSVCRGTTCCHVCMQGNNLLSCLYAGEQPAVMFVCRGTTCYHVCMQGNNLLSCLYAGEQPAIMSVCRGTTCHCAYKLETWQRVHCNYIKLLQVCSSYNFGDELLIN